MKYVQISTSELTGKALDYAVALAGKALDYAVALAVKGVWYNLDGEFGAAIGWLVNLDGVWCRLREFKPSTSWLHGGPLIEQYQIELEWIGTDGKVIAWNAHHQDIVQFQCAETPLIAAMRAIVFAEIGKSVAIPQELIK